MTDIKTAVQQHRNLRTELLARFPELLEDQQALDDTLQGATTLDETIIALVREALAREHQAEGLALLIKKMTDRKSRLLAGADKMREAARYGMEESGIARLIAADFSITMSKGPPKVIITDEAALPSAYVRVKREPDKAEISKWLKAGNSVPGATLSNPQNVMTVRQT